MENDDERASMNPFVQALRGNSDETDGGEARAERPMTNDVAEQSLVAATVEAMSVGAQTAGGGNRVPSPATAAPVQTDGGRMEAVVDLLFGNHLNEINASMRALEKQVAERVNKAEGEMRVRIESIDRHTKGEVDSLNKLIEKERGTRDDALVKIGDRVDTAIRQMEMRLEKVETEMSRQMEMSQRDIDERLAKAADATMLLRKGTEQEILNMKNSLSTRAELGAMFTELGKRLDANASGGGL